MLLTVGIIIVFVSCIGGFAVAGGNPVSLIHAGEIMIICGIGLGILVVSSPVTVLNALKSDIIKAFKGGIGSRDKYIDLLVLLYELFMLGRRKGTPALDEHVSDPNNSSIFTKYPSFLNDAGLVEFLCNSLRPIVDGRCKPGEIGGILASELSSREDEASRSIKAIEMISDALPGVGIVAAVLGIINTMSNLEDPESVGYKVAAALSGTFLGIFLAYGIGVPIGRLVSLNQAQEFLYYRIVERSVSGFATGLSPIMAVEIGRRSLDKQIQPTADELEEQCKDAAKGA
ncbi:flagellar motor stator protein MotA [Opitutales bacterium]|jgi:chemotaxis protein MotA|nr:flagellar motor stator protein MotA [Opitutales bacterium]MDG1173072.1 MotA/TolQ/ExbB proton channel family protein [Opitutales bacterium]